MGTQADVRQTAGSESPAPDREPDHAQELARQLVRHLGIDGAKRTCTENHWQGVLDIIRRANPEN
ncbi:MAG: hypothetical protein WEB93_01005 [Sphingomonadales bacterium]